MTEAILIEALDDPVWTGSAGTDRAAVHGQIVKDILSGLELASALRNLRLGTNWRVDPPGPRESR
jgi:hypothetical protein